MSEIEYEEYIHWGRVAVVLQFILIPVYFIGLMAFFVHPLIQKEAISLPFLDKNATEIYIVVLGPIILALPYWLWTYGERYVIAEAYQRLGTRIWRLPTAIKVFYGLNFLIGIVFLLPLISPIIALFGGFFLAVFVFHLKKEDESLFNRKVLIVTFLYLPFALGIAWGFYSGIVDIFGSVINIWLDNLDLLYISALILADCVTFGGIVYFVYEGAQQVDPTVVIPEGFITLGIFALYIVLEVFYLVFPSFSVYLTWVHYAAVAVGLVIFVIRYLKGLGRSGHGTSLGSWLFILIFQFLNFLSNQKIIGELTGLAVGRTTAIYIAFLIFVGLFMISYVEAKSRF